MQFLIILIDDFDSIRASLLHKDSFPTLEIMVYELPFKETRLITLKTRSLVLSINTVLATHSFLII